MILMTGGAWQGERDCAFRVLEAGEDGTGCQVADGASEEIDAARSAQIWDNVTDWFRRRMEQGQEPEEAEAEVNRLLEVNPELLMITRELGCGLVPIDAFDRRYREAHGRFCCRMAKKADRVYRVSCGLAQCIKGGA